MEHQNSWPGRSPEFERLGNPRLNSEFPIHQLPPSSQAVVSERQSIESRAVSGFQRHRIYRRQNQAPPIESLVHRLRKHSLKPRGNNANILPGSVNIASFRRQRRISHVQGRPGHILMDCDKSRDVVQESTESTTATAQIEQPCDQISGNTLSSFTQHHPNMQHLEPGEPLSPAAEFPSMVMIPESTAEHHVPLLEVDPKQKLGCEDLDLDEGYGDGTDEFVWTNDGPGFHARKSGPLVYRTSSEAAMSCPQIVYKVPRMRRQRHKKNHTRLQTLSSVNLCGMKDQTINNSSYPVDQKNQH